MNGTRKNKRSKVNHSSSEGSVQLFLDELDMKIISRLIRDGKASFHKIASEIGVSPSTVMKRMNKLEDFGVIKGYSAIIDHQKLGYDLTVITEVTVSKGKLLEMESEIAKLPQVCAVYDVTGETDGIIIAKFKNREELSKFTKGLLSMPFIERTNTHVVLTTVKEDFRLPV